MAIQRLALRSVTICACLALCACSSGGDAPAAIAPTPSSTPPEESPSDDAQYTTLTTRTLNADGVDIGLDAYDLIRAFAGNYTPGPIEAPDLYPENHPGVKHIYEDFDATIGHHFVFVIHRDLDKDRDRLENTDRQRNEIKSYGRSEEALKGYENETFIYRWKFRINDGMEVSRRFSHFFQLKAVGGDAGQPILTISGAESGGQDGIEVRHSSRQQDAILQRQDWSLVTGEWLNAYCRVTFSDSGALRLIVTRTSDSAVIFDIDESALDLWRGEDASHFVRPKWGIYRSVLDRENLRPDEEDVRFANFSVQEVMLTG